MKALILAAGLGSRLAPLTNSRPKSLIRINGKEILAKQIDNLLDNNILDITVIAGYLANMTKEFLNSRYPQVNVIINQEYDITNNMFSAYLAKDLLNGEAFFMMNADVFFDSSIIKALLNIKYENAIATDIDNYIEESMKVVSNGDRLVGISKAYTAQQCLGTSIDIYKFSGKAGEKFFIKAQQYIEQRNERKLWSEVAINDILLEADFYACPINDGRWIEIDNHDDLALANKIFI